MSTSTRTKDEALKRLDAAIERLHLGWTQYALYNVRTGGVCALGALCPEAAAAYRSGVTTVPETIDEFVGSDLLREVADQIAELGYDFLSLGPQNHIAEWNDDKGRTAEDVILTLKQARHRIAETW